MRLMLYAVMVAVLAVSGATAYNFSQVISARSSSRAQTCGAFDAYNAAFVKLINQGEQTLPTVAYYRSHPDEMARAIQADENAKKVLAAAIPSYC